MDKTEYEILRNLLNSTMNLWETINIQDGDIKHTIEILKKLTEEGFIKIEGDKIVVIRPTEQKRHRALHGLYRSLINNMVIGVSQGFEKKLEINGVGYRAAIKGKTLTLEVGFSHPVVFNLPEEVEAKIEKNIITITGINKQIVGEISAQIRKIKPPEPYKGKGIKYVEETIRRKAGKVMKSAEGASK